MRDFREALRQYARGRVDYHQQVCPPCCVSCPAVAVFWTSLALCRVNLAAAEPGFVTLSLRLRSRASQVAFSPPGKRYLGRH